MAQLIMLYNKIHIEMKQEVWWAQSSYENMGCDILENTRMTCMQLQHSRCYTVQRCRERGSKGSDEPSFQTRI